VTQPLNGIGAASASAGVTGGRSPRATERTDEGEGFERMLLGQLTKTLVDSALPADGSGSAASTAYKDMLPDALTEALMSGGGIGLAAALQQETGS
jgi:Rod binding domain-containing protein